MPDADQHVFMGVNKKRLLIGPYGSTFDGLLGQKGIREEDVASAVKRVLASQRTLEL